MKKVKLGLFGFGVVGEGIYHVIANNPTLNVELKTIVIRNAAKPRNAPGHLFTSNPADVLEDKDIDLVVELIDDSDAAFSISVEAMKQQKSVVSANKEMIANNHLELIELSKENNVSFLYDAAVCGCIPVIRNLEEFFGSQILTHVRGIVNGSTNYILSQMHIGRTSYAQALAFAQEKGFAESNPALDVEGFDAACKLSIILLHAFGNHVATKRILRRGIASIHPHDIKYARHKGYAIKLIAKCNRNESGELSDISVLPTFVGLDTTLGLTNNEYNSVLIGGSLTDEQLYYGKGAGRNPTSAAILSDITAYQNGYKYKFGKGYESCGVINNNALKIYVSYNKEVFFDSTIFDTIVERFSGNGRNCLIGTISHDKLQRSQLLDNPEISLIAYL